MNRETLGIFINCAPGLITDHESHGEGLIAYALANGLAQRGHRVHVFTDSASVDTHHPNLHIHKGGTHRVPLNSLAPWEQMARADAYLHELLGRGEKIDVVWRMYGGGCVRPPATEGRPLVIGPLSYAWPRQKGVRPTLGRPRFGIGIGPVVSRAAARGKQASLARAALLLYDTDPHAAAMAPRFPNAIATGLPLNVDPPAALRDCRRDTIHDPLQLIFVANLNVNKRPDVFCQTVLHLRKRGIAAHGTIIGDGPERTTLEEWCRENSLVDAVEFAGRVPNTLVYERIADADLMISTSVGEPYGRSIAEAMAVGTPPVCHRSGGPADFVRDGVDGLLVENLEPEEYARAIARFIEEPGLWQRLSKNARVKARDEWTSDAVLTRLEGYLRDICRRK